MIAAAGSHFPKLTIPVEISDFRYGADYAVSTHTDEARETYKYPAELYLWKHNLKASIFDSPVVVVQEDALLSELNGKVRFQLYTQTERWWKDGNYDTIPDWGNTAWTVAGEAVFSGAVAGQPKTQYYPNHGQELYDISGGVYGYDFVGDQVGSNNLQELFDRLDYERDFFKDLLGRRVSCVSYRNGQHGDSPLLVGRFLGGRNSNTANYSFGESRQGGFLGSPQEAVTLAGWIDRPSHFRWWASTVGGTTNFGVTATKVAEVKADKGFLNMFMHWNDPYNAGTPEKTGDVFDDINTEVGSDFAWRCGHGEAIEYAFFREGIRRVGAHVEGSDVVIVVEKKDPYSGTVNGRPQHLEYACLNTPISIKIDLTGTPLAGLDVVTDSVGIRSLGSNEYVVDISPGNGQEGVRVARLSSGTPDYYDFTLPTITSISVVGADLRVVTNVPTRCCVFKNTRGGGESTVTLKARSVDLSTTHDIPVETVDLQGDLYVGVCTREGQSVLSAAQSLL